MCSTRRRNDQTAKYVIYVLNNTRYKSLYMRLPGRLSEFLSSRNSKWQVRKSKAKKTLEESIEIFYYMNEKSED